MSRATIASIACGAAAGKRACSARRTSSGRRPRHAASPLQALLARERGRELRRAVAALPAKYRVPLVLAYFNDLGYAEIGELLGIERGHVAVLVFRARQQLRRTLTVPDGSNR